jgi:cytochrome c biogenesis protein CcdA
VIVVGGRMISGYSTDATTGKQIEDLLRAAAVPQKKTTQRDAGSSVRPLASMTPLSWFAFVGAEPEPASHVAVAPPPVSSSVAPPPLPPAAAPSRPVAVAPPPPPANSASSVAAPPPPAGESESTLALPPEETVSEEIDIPYLGPLRLRDWGLPAFTFLIGLIDGFNPCAMWVLVFLLSVLVNVKSRLRILVIAGTFVAVSGLAYFAFMAAWLNFFMLISMQRELQIGLGLFALLIGAVNIKDFFAFKKGISFSIPESAKPAIYQRVRDIVAAKYLTVAVASAVVLAVGVNTIELICTAGLPALYTDILMMQKLPTWQNYAYLALYNVAYMLDDSMLLGAFVITLSRRKLQEKEGRWLKLVSGVVVLSMGLIMLFKPEWLHPFD